MRHFGDYKVHTTSQLFPITRAYLFPQYKMSHGKVTFTKKVYRCVFGVHCSAKRNILSILTRGFLGMQKRVCNLINALKTLQCRSTRQN